MDRSIGALRKGLRDLDIADNTLVWFCSDNGGLPGIKPDTVGGLRGNKNSIFEGGLRVPGIIEWPAVIRKSRITNYPAATMDIFPTIAEIVGLPDSAMIKPCDGMSIRPLFDGEIGPRIKPLGFRHTGRAAFIDNDYKLLIQSLDKPKFELYNLAKDQNETTDIYNDEPEIAERMTRAFLIWNSQVEASLRGGDYPERRVIGEPEPQRRWSTSEEYKPYLEQFKKRPEYEKEIKNALK
jgi:arylsulfatase A-like enzyme